MSRDSVVLECPECGHSEEATLGPTVAISADVEMAVERIDCWSCGYEGPP